MRFAHVLKWQAEKSKEIGGSYGEIIPFYKSQQSCTATPNSTLLTSHFWQHPPSSFLLSPSSFLLTFLERAPAAASETYP